MFFTIILILLYWLALSFIYLLNGQIDYFYAFFPGNYVDLQLRFIGILFIIAGNLYLLRKNNIGNTKKAEKADPSYGLKEALFKEDLQFHYDIKNKEEISIKNKYVIYKTKISIMKLIFEKISLETFIKLSFKSIVSNRFFLNCMGAMLFLPGDQKDSFKFNTSFNVPSSIVEGCDNSDFQHNAWNAAIRKKSIQFINNNKQYPKPIQEYFSENHCHYCVPLKYQNELVGLIDFVLPPGVKRTKEADEYLIAMAEIVTTGIRYKQKMKQRDEIDKCLFGLSGNYQENIKKLVYLYGKILKATCAFYKRYDKNTDSFNSVVQYNPPRFYNDKENQGSISHDIVTGDGQPVVINGLMRSKYKKKDLNIVQNNFSSCTGVQIKYKNKPVGVLLAFSKKNMWRNKGLEKKAAMIASAIGTEEERIYENKILKEAYSKLEKAQNSLIQAEKLAALGRFSSGVAHEVKNPLGVILGGVEFLDKKSNDLDKDAKLALEKIKYYTLRANNIVQNLLTFAKPAERKIEIIHLKEVIEETLSLIKYKVSLTKIRITNEIKDNSKAIQGDRGQIQQVFFNLFLNAVEAMPRGGKLIIRLHKFSNSDLLKGEKGSVVEVVDTGEGIPEKNLSKIFEPFFTTKRDTKGTGLGLAMCRMIIENNGGRLFVESSLGKGTTVRIIFPLAEEKFS